MAEMDDLAYEPDPQLVDWERLTRLRQIRAIESQDLWGWYAQQEDDHG